jgi:UDPglucose 6-dehydrogenase
MYKGKVLIVGFGVVGNNMRKLLEPHVQKLFIHDPAKGYTHTEPVDIAFVCVPTDSLPDGSADTSIVEKVCEGISESRAADVIVIKSTVPPGTSEKILQKLADNRLTTEVEFTGPGVVFSPEYFGGTQHANAVNNDFVILGAADYCIDALNKVAELYKHIFDGRGRIVKTDWKTAELVKYMENAFFATKVAFVNEFSLYAEHIGVDRDELRELWLLDDRIGWSHTFSYRDAPFYDSHCLNKDIPAICAQAAKDGTALMLLEHVRNVNDTVKAPYGKEIAEQKEQEKSPLQRDAEIFMRLVRAYGLPWQAELYKKEHNKVSVVVGKSTNENGIVFLYESKGANVEDLPVSLRESVLVTLRTLGFERTYV